MVKEYKTVVILTTQLAESADELNEYAREGWAISRVIDHQVLVPECQKDWTVEYDNGMRSSYSDNGMRPAQIFLLERPTLPPNEQAVLKRLANFSPGKST